MPSLPELEVYRAQIQDSLVGQAVARAEVLDWRVMRADLEALNRQLEGRSLTAIKRYGKYLSLDFGFPEQLIMHLGLKGRLSVTTAPAPKSPVFILHFENNQDLILGDIRKLARIYWKDFAAVIAEKRLGPDQLTVSAGQFAALLQRKRRAIRDVLMDQHVIAGIGGKYADELLWQAKLHPNVKADSLDELVYSKLFELLKAITQTAIELNADPERFPEDWLIPHCHGDQICPRCGAHLAERKLGGSETFYCPEEQTPPMPFRSG